MTLFSQITLIILFLCGTAQGETLLEEYNRNFSSGLGGSAEYRQAFRVRVEEHAKNLEPGSTERDECLYILVYLAYGDDYRAKARDWTKAIAEAETFLREAQAASPRARIEMLLGNIYEMQHKIEEAKIHLERSLMESDRIPQKTVDERVDQLACMWACARNASGRGDFDKARALYDAMRNFNSRGIPRGHPRRQDMIYLKRNGIAGYLELTKGDPEALVAQGRRFLPWRFEKTRKGHLKRLLNLSKVAREIAEDVALLSPTVVYPTGAEQKPPPEGLEQKPATAATQPPQEKTWQGARWRVVTLIALPFLLLTSALVLIWGLRRKKQA